MVTSSAHLEWVAVRCGEWVALSKAGTAVWGGAGGMVEAKSASMGDYFERGGMNR